jgi:rapamycin-insensitive companion of mTOR
MLTSPLQMPPWTVEVKDSDNRLIPITSDAELEVMTAIHNLSNAVIANTASRSLAKSYFPSLIVLAY